MASTKAKYRIISGFSNADKFELNVNILAEQGYTVSHFSTENSTLSAIMKLDIGYQDVVNLKDVDPLEVDKHISEGWEICSTSISTKFIRMIRRKAYDGSHA